MLTRHVHRRHRAHRPGAGAGRLGSRAARGGRGRGGSGAPAGRGADPRAVLRAALRGQARRARRDGPRGGDGGAGGDLRNGGPRGDVCGAALLRPTPPTPPTGRCCRWCRSARPRSRRRCCSSSWSGRPSRRSAPRSCWRTDGPRLLPPPPAQRAPLPRAPAHRTGGEDPLREVAHGRDRVGAAVRGADLGDRGASCRPAERPAVATERVALDVALSRLALPDREVRRTAAEAVTAALEPGLRTRAFVFNTLLATSRSTTACAATRNWLAARNLANEASDESVAALIEAVRGRYELARRWYRLKAGLLGIERLADYDRMAAVTAGRGELHLRAGARAGARLLLLLLPRAGRRSRGASSPSAGSTRRCARPSAAARSAPRRCPPRTRTCCSTSPRAGATC